PLLYTLFPYTTLFRSKFSYFPFGGGPRVCIGEQFAWMEGVLLIATIAQGWKMRLAPDQIVEPKPMITLRPRYGMRMVVAEKISKDRKSTRLNSSHLGI